MSIQRTIIHECTGYYKGYRHVFEYIDDNRKVDINITGEIICRIKNHLDFSPNTTNKKLIAYKSKWNRYLNHYLIADGINSYIDEGQSYVNKNYELLKENKLLSYNEALFLLLGLNAHELGRGIKDFPVLNGDEPIAQLFELDFWRTKQNQALKQSVFVVDGKITSEKLKELAKENNFFTTPKQPNQKTVQKDENIEIVKTTLVNFLKQSKSKSKYNKNSLKQSAELMNILKDNGLVVIETNMDASKKPSHRKSNEITPATLYDYLTAILKSNWWTEQDKPIQNKVKNYQ